jgi:tellurite resistance protein TerC
MFEMQTWLWILFNLLITGMLILDLGVLNRKTHAISSKEALLWSTLWIAVSLGFNVVIYFVQGPEKALEFFTGYLIEKALSVDNIFVFVLIFSYFQISPLYQPRVLKWGIIGAIAMRAIFIFVGIELVHAFHWMIYVFGGFLVVTGVKLALQRDEKLEPEKNPVLRLFRKFFKVTDNLEGEKFFTRVNGSVCATPLFVALLMVESSDLVFALDSIPAIFAITTDSFIVYTSNIFAILGLRALYFLLASVLNMFAYLKFGLSVILVFVGIKMLLTGIYKIPIAVSLSVIFVILVVSIIISLISNRKRPVAAIIGEEAKADYSDNGSLAKANPQEEGSNGKTECSSLKDINEAQSTYYV